MHRRQFVASATATIATVSLAGCSGILGGDGGGGSSGPEGAVQAYVDAFNDNDPDALRAAVHPDAPDSSIEDVTASDMQDLSMSLNSAEVVEGPENGQAVVEAEIESTVETMGEEQTETETMRFEVRQHDGEWTIYDDA